MPVKSTIERAFEVAREGKCSTVSEIERVLMREGHEFVTSHLSGTLIRKQLKSILKQLGFVAAPRVRR